MAVEMTGFGLLTIDIFNFNSWLLYLGFITAFKRINT